MTVPPETVHRLRSNKLSMNLQHQEPRAKSEDQHYVLRLFVAGTTPNSLRAIQNVRA